MFSDATASHPSLLRPNQIDQYSRRQTHPPISPDLALPSTHLTEYDFLIPLVFVFAFETKMYPQFLSPYSTQLSRYPSCM